jgi:hypothetical protein
MRAELAGEVPGTQTVCPPDEDDPLGSEQETLDAVLKEIREERRESLEALIRKNEPDGA